MLLDFLARCERFFVSNFYHIFLLCLLLYGVYWFLKPKILSIYWNIRYRSSSSANPNFEDIERLRVSRLLQQQKMEEIARQKREDERM